MSDSEPFLPYGRQTICEDDIAAVVNVLRMHISLKAPQFRPLRET